MDASLYHPLYLAIVSVLCISYSILYCSSPGYERQEREIQNSLFPFIGCLVLAVWLGHRPISGTYFGDTGTYAGGYLAASEDFREFDWHQEWFWQWITTLCKWLQLNVWSYFTVIALGYVLSAFWAVQRLMPGKSILGMLFVLISFSCFTYGTNGLRNGLACHLLLLALSFLTERRYLIWGLLCVLALGIHRSVMLPIAAMAASNWLLPRTKYALLIWVASIPLSLIFGETLTQLFTALGFDNRMEDYTNPDKDLTGFSYTGFRWDFLLYSSVPVLLTTYIEHKERISDRIFHLLASTYCLSNAFWIIVIRSSFSNRFAYLSWFLYPLVIAYPLLSLPLWEDQDRKIGIALLLFCAFTLFLELYYW